MVNDEIIAILIRDLEAEEIDFQKLGICLNFLRVLITLTEGSGFRIRETIWYKRDAYRLAASTAVSDISIPMTFKPRPASQKASYPYVYSTKQN